jgi:hypothetical protein
MGTIKKTDEISIKKLIANDFKEAMAGKLDLEQLEATCEYLMSDSTSGYRAIFSIGGLVFYMKFEVKIDDPDAGTYNHYHFDATGGGLSFPFQAEGTGYVYTDDLNALIKNTHSFLMNCTPVYTSMVFFDESTNCLGSFQSALVSPYLFTGGGTGTWSK